VRRTIALAAGLIAAAGLTLAGAGAATAAARHHAPAIPAVTGCSGADAEPLYDLADGYNAYESSSGLLYDSVNASDWCWIPDGTTGFNWLQNRSDDECATASDGGAGTLYDTGCADHDNDNWTRYHPVHARAGAYIYQLQVNSFCATAPGVNQELYPTDCVAGGTDDQLWQQP
jgi:hypothetical protein